MTHAEAYDTVSTHDGTVRQPLAFHGPRPGSPGIVIVENRDCAGFEVTSPNLLT